MPPLLSEVAGLAPRIDDVVRRAIAKHPQSRYRTMMEMSDALQELRSWLIDEERAGRLMMVLPLGQPPIPGEHNPYDFPAAPTALAAFVPAGAALDARIQIREPHPARKDDPR